MTEKTSLDIYFSGSISGGRSDAPLYKKIVELLKGFGNVFLEQVGDLDLGQEGEKLPAEEIYEEDMKLLEKSDVVVAEVTQPSLGVGYEIGRAVVMRKRILCLFRPESGRRLSPMIKGCPSVTVNEYGKENMEEEVTSVLKAFFDDTTM